MDRGAYEDNTAAYGVKWLGLVVGKRVERKGGGRNEYQDFRLVWILWRRRLGEGALL